MDRKKQKSKKQYQAKNKQLKARKRRLQAKSEILKNHQSNQLALTDHIYCLKISLQNFEPVIWRRIEVPDVSLDDLHYLIQSAMGWENCHLFGFNVAGQSYGPDPENDLFGNNKSSCDFTISSLVNEHGGQLTFEYEYDFGDGWIHELKLEKVLDQAEPGKHYPRCTDGENACPPEDIGGVWGYSDFLEVISDPDHPDHEDKIEWHGEFDPAEFNPKTVSAYWEAAL